MKTIKSIIFLNRHILSTIIIVLSVMHSGFTQSYENLKVRQGFMIDEIDKLNDSKYIFGEYSLLSGFVYDGDTIISRSATSSIYERQAIIVKFDKNNNYISHVECEEFKTVVENYSAEGYIYFVGLIGILDTIKGRSYRHYMVMRMNEDMEYEELFSFDYSEYRLDLAVRNGILCIGGIFGKKMIFGSDTLHCETCYAGASPIYNIIYDIDNKEVLFFDKIHEHSSDQVKSIAINSQGDCIVAGSFESHGTFILGSDSIPLSLLDFYWDHYGYIYKMSDHGEPVFLKGIPSTGDARIRDMVIDPEDNIYILINTSSYTAYYDDILLHNFAPEDYHPMSYIAKLNIDGELIWRKPIYCNDDRLRVYGLKYINGRLVVNGRSFNDIYIEEVKIPIVEEDTEFLLNLESDDGTFNSILLFPEYQTGRMLNFNDNVFTVLTYGNPKVLFPDEGIDEKASIIFDIVGDLSDERNIENNDIGISIYPNPVSRKNLLHIVIPTSHVEYIELIDMQGNIVKHLQRQDTTDMGVDISDLSSGVYILEVKTERYRSIKKVIVTE